MRPRFSQKTQHVGEIDATQFLLADMFLDILVRLKQDLWNNSPLSNLFAAQAWQGSQEWHCIGARNISYANE